MKKALYLITLQLPVLRKFKKWGRSMMLFSVRKFVIQVTALLQTSLISPSMMPRHMSKKVKVP